MKKKIYLAILMAVLKCSATFAQEPIEINGFLIFEKQNDLFNIVGTDTLQVVEDVITVRFKSDATTDKIDQIESKFGLSKTFQSSTGWINYKISDNLITLVQELSKSETVDEVLINRYIPLMANPNDPGWTPFCSTMHNTIDEFLCAGTIVKNSSHFLMRIDSAWGITTGSPEVIIGFIDSGIDIFNPELGYGTDNYHNLWENPENPGEYGWNFVQNNSDIVDVSGHGTLVSAIACAKTNNNYGTFGVAGGWGNQGSRVMTLNIDALPSTGHRHSHTLAEFAVAPAIYFAVEHGARIINMSFGGYHWYNPAIDSAIQMAYNKHNVLFFAAAGNYYPRYDTVIAWPASHINVVAIGASDWVCCLYYTDVIEKHWKLEGGQGSSIGSELDIVAPQRAYTYFEGGLSYISSMTSGSTAYLSGIAALILSVNPYLTNSEVIEMLTSTADKIDPTHSSWQPNGHSIHYGYGRVNAHQAVLAALPEPEITITTHVVWDTPRRQAGNVIIEPGASLTITSMLYMHPETRIIVKRGGRLNIDQGTVTSAGFENFWTGIEVWGNSSQRQLVMHQGVMHQGWVRIVNGGSVRNSEMGIYTNRMDATTGGWVSGYTGGIVQGNNASFVNNKVSLQFFPYNFPSVSGFSSSEFITDDGLHGGAPDDWMVEITGMNGVKFSACRFLNQSVNHEYFKNGIRIVNSYVKIGGQCTSTALPCQEWEYSRFERLYYGIYATAVSTSRFVDIQRTEFKNNFRGLYLGGITNALVLSNRFMVNSPFVANGGYGMYLDVCTGYWVEDNHFIGQGASWIGIGLIVNNSGTAPNEIYRNWFENLQKGISAQGVNRHPRLNQGLQILCNEFINCGADLLILPSLMPEGGTGWGQPSPITQGGIAPHQGANMPNVHTAMAGNLFDIHSSIPDGDFDDINNQAEHIIYYYPSLSDDERVFPVDITLNTVHRQAVEFLPDNVWTFEAGCPPTIDDNGGTIRQELLYAAGHWSAQASQAEEQLTALIDAGNTEELQWEVYMATNPEAMQIYNELMALSPYLSDTVVSNAIFKDDVLVNAMLRDIMVANPHTAKSPELMEMLDQRWVPLPEFMKEQVLQGRNIVTTREALEANLAQYELNHSVALSKLARFYHNNPDSLGWLYSLHNDAMLGYKHAFSLLQHGMALQGMEVLNNMAVQLCPSGLTPEKHTWMVENYSLLVALLEQESGITKPGSAEIAQAWAIHDNASGLPAAYARGLLQVWGLIEYQEPILHPETYKSATGKAVVLAGCRAEGNLLLSVRPNPARDYLIITWELPSDDKAALEFTDANGRMVHRQKLLNAKDEQVVAIQNWKPGAYQATIRTDSGGRQTVRFIVSR